MKGLITFMGWIFVLGAFGQTFQDTTALEHRKKIALEVTFGTAFSTSQYGSSYGLYLSPRVAYPLTDRFSLRVGGIFRNYAPVTTFGNPYVNDHPFHSSQMQSLLMVEGAYRLNEKLTLTGMVYREIPNGTQHHPERSFDVRGMIMGVDYQVNDNVFIRGQIEVSNDRYPYYYSPLADPHGRGFYDPFYHSP